MMIFLTDDTDYHRFSFCAHPCLPAGRREIYENTFDQSVEFSIICREDDKAEKDIKVIFLSPWRFTRKTHLKIVT